MSNHSNNMSTGIALLLTFGIMIFIGLLLDLGTPKCSKPGCDHDAKEGSSYCWLHGHDTYRYSSGKSTYGSSSTSSAKSNSSASGSSKSSGSSASASSKTTSDAAKVSSRKSNSSGSSSSKKNHSSMDSYDDGYNAVYEDDDYDWDRYRTDDEYAAGVDDAMEDEGEDW